MTAPQKRNPGASRGCAVQTTNNAVIITPGKSLADIAAALAERTPSPTLGEVRELLTRIGRSA